jgi:hypothetical protein
VAALCASLLERSFCLFENCGCWFAAFSVFGCVFEAVFGFVFEAVFGFVFEAVFGCVFEAVFGFVFEAVFGYVFEPVFGFVFETLLVQALSWTHVLIYKPPGGGRYR